ncbi:MAG: hypothetical protein AAF702_25660 [Chloroflexota bacterium]
MQYMDPHIYNRTVLICVVNNQDDMRRIASEGWYRIPQRRAPKRVGADFLAFYQTGKFKGQPEAQTVTYFAPTLRYHLMTRAELMPDEADHTRAGEFYFRIDMGPLQRLERPIPASKMKRVTFIHSTMDRLMSAETVNELFNSEDPFERLWHALRQHRLRPLKNRLVGDYPVDITLRARGGYLGVRCKDERVLREQGALVLPERWEMLYIAPQQVEEDMNGCLRQIGAALINLGGSQLELA